ncbi:MAG: 23S rRNA (pseudouridine(1915)-N(3))-methyltransferase RlmH [Clostridia bacterium]|nr:23S rRNA (pseudouridine(1915)-N(3))-methyltransferase RlmH [Clostridia bacterium]MDD4375383.1 23S rRNA (pseudouridine(1915)-N(3))-methyltransferase RlmH [Clostridia bacterium]
MSIKVICHGKIKEKSITLLIDEYIKRLSRFCKLQIIELADEKLPTTESTGALELVKEKEANMMLSKLNNYKNAYIICLDERGKEFSSTEFANNISEISQKHSTIIFCIGGSLGLSEKVKNKANLITSFSKLTFPHQLFRVFLLEQIFRSFKINNNEMYHH